MFCSAETPPARRLSGCARCVLRMPAHPRRSSSKTQSLMLKTGHCRPHNSFDGLSGYFKACTSALFARHPHDQTQPFMPETGQRAHRKFPTRPSNTCSSAPFKQQNAVSHARNQPGLPAQALRMHPKRIAERASLTPAPRPSMACNRRSAPARAPYRRREGARPRSAPRRPPTARRFPAPAARSRRASAGRRAG